MWSLIISPHRAARIPHLLRLIHGTCQHLDEGSAKGATSGFVHPAATQPLHAAELVDREPQRLRGGGYLGTGPGMPDSDVK